MEEDVGMAKHLETFLTNHGLIKLIIIDSMQQKVSTWTKMLAKSRHLLAHEEEKSEAKEQEEKYEKILEESVITPPRSHWRGF